MPSSPRTAKIVTAAEIQWSDGKPFDGYLWLGLRLPNNYNEPRLWAANVLQKLPQFTKIPIVEGVLDTDSAVFFNEDLDPPNTTYFAYWFDQHDRLIAPTSGTAVGFSITADPHTITPPTLTVPSYAGATDPTPET